MKKESGVGHCRLSICRLSIVDCRLSIADCRLPICRLSDSAIADADCRIVDRSRFNGKSLSDNWAPK